MSETGVLTVIEKWAVDTTFRERWRADPEAVLAEFDLTAEEIAALKSQDAIRIQKLGLEVDERIQKGALPN